MGGCHSSVSKKAAKGKTGYQLNITTRTTIKAYNYLFDANDPTSIIRHNFKISEPGFLIRNDAEVTYSKKKSKFTYPNGEIILNLKLKNNHLSINKPVIPKTEDGVNLEIEKQMLEMPWILANKPEQKKDWKGLKIKKGDIIRFGRIKFRVKAKNPLMVDSKGRKINLERTISDASSVEENNENSSMDTERLEDDINKSLRTRSESIDPQFHGRDQNKIATMVNLDQRSNSNGSGGPQGTVVNLDDKEHEHEHEHEHEIHHTDVVNQNPENLNFEGSENSEKKLDSENKACRICLWDDEEVGDPIIQPCKCSGTIKNVHIGCFKSWIGKKVDRKVSKSMESVFWKRLQCEICHTEVAPIIEWKGKSYNLVDVPVVEAPNLVLEYFHNEKVLGYHIIKFDAQESKRSFGRGSNCDIRVHDNTVSRMHAHISHVNQQFYLTDLESKYGTYLLLDETHNIVKANNQFSLQVGRTIIDCQVTKVKNLTPTVNIPIKVHPASQNLTVSTDRLSLRSKDQAMLQSKVIHIQENVESRNANPPNRGSRTFQSHPTIIEEERKDNN